MTDEPLYTGLLGEIAEAVGWQAAAAIQAARGGTRVDFPARAKPDHWLTRAVGFDKADQICRALAITDADGRLKGVRHEVLPSGDTGVMARARTRFVKLREAGHSVREASLAVGVHERTGFAWEARRVRGADSRQMQLF